MLLLTWRINLSLLIFCTSFHFHIVHTANSWVFVFVVRKFAQWLRVFYPQIREMSTQELRIISSFPSAANPQFFTAALSWFNRTGLFVSGYTRRTSVLSLVQHTIQRGVLLFQQYGASDTEAELYTVGWRQNSTVESSAASPSDHGHLRV